MPILLSFVFNEFKEALPNLFGIACTKNAMVATHWEFFGGSNR